jgi:hypothetical protein
VSAPRARTASIFSGEPTDAITIAPASFAACTAALATPPDADGTRTASPGLTPATLATIDHAVLTAHWAAAAGTKSSSLRSGMTARAGTRTSSAYPPQQSVPNTVKRWQRSSRQLVQQGQLPQANCW